MEKSITIYKYENPLTALLREIAKILTKEQAKEILKKMENIN